MILTPQIEYQVVYFNKETGELRLSLHGDEVIETLQKDERELPPK